MGTTSTKIPVTDKDATEGGVDAGGTRNPKASNVATGQGLKGSKASNAVIEQRLKNWKEKLLDLSKRNHMLNFRPRKASTLEIEEDFSDFLTSFVDEEFPVVYDTPDADDEPDEDLDGSEDSDEPEDLEEKKKVRQQHRVLWNIAKKIRLADEEFGYNVGYVAYGFLNWTESDDSEMVMKSPLILIPAKVTQEDRFSAFIVEIKTDEDIQINPTIVEKLRTDFGLELGLERFSDLSSAANIKQVIKAFADKIQGQEGWSIGEEIYLDTFDFQNMVILNDLKVNGNMVTENPFSRALASGTALNSADDGGVEEVPEWMSGEQMAEVDLDSSKSKDKLEILDADSSQEEAIYRARKGESFVIQGPPGTGKSQTIANIIAGALYDGKSVLFVSEKQAALDVVYEKLRRANLAVFCLKMHNYRQNKNDIREQLKASIDLADDRRRVDPAEMNIYEGLDRAKLKLNAYDETLHTPIEPIGKTPYWLMGQLTGIKSAVELHAAVPMLDYNTTVKLFDDLKQYVNTFEKESDEFTRSGWNNYHGEINLKAFKKLTEEAEKTKLLIQKYHDEQKKLGSMILETKLSWPDFLDTLSKLVKTLEKHAEYKSINREWVALDDENIKKIKNYLNSLNKLFEKYNAELAEYDKIFESKQKIENEIGGEFDTRIIKVEKELVELLPKFKNEYNSRLKRLGSEYRGDMKKIYRYAHEGTEKSLVGAVRILELLQKRMKAAELWNAAKERVEEVYQQIADSLENVPVELDSLQKMVRKYQKVPVMAGAFEPALLMEQMAAVEYYASLRRMVLDAATFDDETYADIVELGPNAKVVKDFERISQLMQEIAEKIDALPLIFVEPGTGTCEKIEQWAVKYDEFDWVKQEDFEKHALTRAQIEDEYDLKELLDEVESLHILKQDIISSIKRQMYIEYLEKSEIRAQYITNYHRDVHDQIVADFKAYDERQRKIAAERVRCKLISEIPDFSGFSTVSTSSGEIELLKREVAKKSRLLPTRKLIAKIPVLLPKLKPCIMMSPITVSSYFSSNPEMKFDLVIFDEASQVKPETAITSLMRARQLIVAGDSKQMPPTNFFDATADGGFDDGDGDGDGALAVVGDLESVLDELTVVMPQFYLKWHYRSRDESLIEFSNRKFYEKRLYTFPSVYRNNEEVGVEFVYVENGVWQSREGNEVEAEKVAELVFEHFREHPEDSLGVVAFGKSQANAIEEAILKMRDMNPEYEEYFSDDKDEPFFVKNLENVQGDERDAIILSVGYGKGPDGSFKMRFGPLAVAGGERRLNVAISRSKKRMVVVSSFHAKEVRDDGKENRKLLKDFIDFAEHGQMELIVEEGDGAGVEENKVLAFDSPFEESVYDFIVANGYTAKTQVGASGYKIDMAIVNPNDTNRYLLAIECDGAAYHSSRTARDRDRLRQSILEEMGWNFYRVWSTDWFHNRKKEEAKLLTAIENAVAGKKVVETKLDGKLADQEIKTVSDDTEKRIDKEMGRLRERYAKYVFSSSSSWYYSSSAGYYECIDMDGWREAIKLALNTNYNGMSREDFARYVVKKFLLRDKLSTNTKSYCMVIIRGMIEDGELVEKDGSLVK